MGGPAGTDPWFFVMQVSPQGPAPEFEIQLLNRDGQAIDWVRFVPGVTDLVLGGRPVPISVIKAALERVPGDGQYVDGGGVPTRPF